MVDRRLTPDELRARLQANLAGSPQRGTALSAVANDGPAPIVAERITEPVAAAPIITAPAVNATTVEVVKVTAPTVDVPAVEQERASISRPRARPPRVIEPSVPPANGVVHRSQAGAVLRGYRIPLDLHRRAERAKLAASAKRGATLFWDEILQSAIDGLPTPTVLAQQLSLELPAEFATGRRSGAQPAGATRVLQATIRHDQELHLRTLRLDLEELTGRVVRLEEVWTWLLRRVVEEHTQSS